MHIIFHLLFSWLCRLDQKHPPPICPVRRNPANTTACPFWLDLKNEYIYRSMSNYGDEINICKFYICSGFQMSIFSCSSSMFACSPRTLKCCFVTCFFPRSISYSRPPFHCFSIPTPSLSSIELAESHACFCVQYCLSSLWGILPFRLTFQFLYAFRNPTNWRRDVKEPFLLIIWYWG